MVENKNKPGKKKLDIAKILADPEKAIAELLSSPEILAKIPEALGKLPADAKKALALEISKYLPPAAGENKINIDYKSLATEVVKLLPPTEPIPTVEEIAVEAAKLVQFPPLDDIAKKLAEIIPHPVEDELVDKVIARTAVQTTEKLNKIETRITDLEKKLTDQLSSLDKLITQKTETIFKQHADELKTALQEAVAKAGKDEDQGSSDQDSDKAGTVAGGGGITGTAMAVAEPLIALGEKYPKMAEILLNKIFKTPAEDGPGSELRKYFSWHKIFKDMEQGNVEQAIDAIGKQTTQQPGA